MPKRRLLRRGGRSPSNHFREIRRPPYYRWLKELFGGTVGLIGVTMIALLPPIVTLTSEVRQYSLLLLFITCAAFLLERAFAKRSAPVMVCSFVCLWLAMLSHYSALI